MVVMDEHAWELLQIHPREFETNAVLVATLGHAGPTKQINGLEP